MIVGTAGHIDHGKTSLVRALSSVDTDRLKEEKERGISIELGFAYVPLGARALGFVDVPGHERLIHTMAAGACGIDLALLAIAADDGIMPQTREHLAILELLGVEHAVIALTKVDRVEESRARAVEAEVGQLLSNTVFAGAPVFPVNATAPSDAGTQRLREYLWRVAHDFENRNERTRGRDRLLFRLAIDRVFTLEGRGTVIAGTVFSGTVRTDDTVVLFPANLTARVRSIHAQNRPAEIGRAGERVALNLTGIDKSTIKRGDWIADARLLAPTSRIDARVRLLADGRSVLKAWTPVHFHHGASHRTARAVPLDTATILAGPRERRGYVQLVFDAPICAVPGDKFILRDAQAAHTIGGGVVLDPFAVSRKRRSPERFRYLQALEGLIAGEVINELVAEAPYGTKVSELIRLTGQERPESAAANLVIVDTSHERYVVPLLRGNGCATRRLKRCEDFMPICLRSPDPTWAAFGGWPCPRCRMSSGSNSSQSSSASGRFSAAAPGCISLATR
jgi:selenocysteine-specific elongation factor